MRKRMISLFLSVVLVLACAITASAASTSSSVTLKTTQYSASSGTVGLSDSVYVYAKNNSSSAHNVKAITYAAPSGGSFYQADSVTMGKGTTMNTKTVKGPSSSASYYLQLNPAGLYKNCSATGTINCK